MGRGNSGQFKKGHTPWSKGKSIVSIKERLESKTMYEPNTGCWYWTGSILSSGGYGEVKINGKKRRAHRLNYELHKGKIPKGKQVLHHCDNPLCINPDHLFLGTHLDNMADRQRKGRQPKGITHGQSTFTPELVLAIRNTKGKTSDIAKEFNVSQNQVSRIRLKRRWKHL